MRGFAILHLHFEHRAVKAALPCYDQPIIIRCRATATPRSCPDRVDCSSTIGIHPWKGREDDASDDGSSTVRELGRPTCYYLVDRTRFAPPAVGNTRASGRCRLQSTVRYRDANASACAVSFGHPAQLSLTK